MWQVIAAVHYQESNYSTRQIKLPAFIVNYAENGEDLRNVVNKIVNPTDNKNIRVLIKASKKITRGNANDS
jgi:hypothetical protein